MCKNKSMNFTKKVISYKTMIYYKTTYHGKILHRFPKYLSWVLESRHGDRGVSSGECYFLWGNKTKVEDMLYTLLFSKKKVN